MADKLRLGSEVRELKIGDSFRTNKSDNFHTIRYDFKPASVDINKIATVGVGNNNQVTVTVPHLDGAGVPQTVFKGSQRPFQKECVLIIDRVTGEITLEKLSGNIQVKKTRSESTRPPLPQDRAGGQGSAAERSGSSLGSSRSQTPPVGTNQPQIGHRQSNKTRVTSGSRRADRQITQITHLVPKHSPLHASPNPNYPSPGHHKSPKRDRADSHHESSHAASQSTLASLPMIGIDDFDPLPPPPVQLPPPLPQQQHHHHHHDSVFAPLSDNEHHAAAAGNNGIVDEMTSSSSDSSSDSDSDHDSGPDSSKPAAPAVSVAPLPPPSSGRSNGHSNGGTPSKMSMPTQLLNEDLCLSESGSDSE